MSQGKLKVINHGIQSENIQSPDHDREKKELLLMFPRMSPRSLPRKILRRILRRMLRMLKRTQFS